MSNEYGETKKNGFHYLDQLKRKKMVQTKPEFIIHLNQGKKVETLATHSSSSEFKRNVTPKGSTFLQKQGELEEEKSIINKPKSNILFSDKRKENDINRNILLERLNKYSNKRIVETKDETKNRPSSGEDIRSSLTNRDIFKIPDVPMGELPKTTEEKQTFTIKIKKKMIIPTAEPIIATEPQEEELPDELSDLEEEEKAEAEAEAEEKTEEKAEEPKKTFMIKVKKGKKKEEPVLKEIEKEKEETLLKEGEKEPTGKEKKKTTRKKYEPLLFGENEEIGKNVKINKTSVLSRLPKREKFVLKTSEFYMNNRKLYIQKMSELFKPYKKELIESLEKSPSSNKNIDFKLLTHQKVVRDYLNLYTPYRGLLIYHMLGSGKSCTSIAVAEGMKSQRPIVLMTPASLKMNFFGELKKCGDLMYRRNQYWEFINTGSNPEYVDILSKVLLISKQTIQKNSGAWLVDYTKATANFNDLTTEQQKSIDQQIDAMIRSKYQDINYNGLNKRALVELTDNFTKNPFDNVTVIIDEAHNFVSRIVNKIKKPKSLSYILYDYLMKAQNARIVLVTGTPVINYPNELGILFNILRGYIKQWTFQISIKNTAPAGFKVNRDEILRIFKKEGLNTFDYVEYSGNKLVVTRNPFGFINTEKHKKVKGGDDKKNKNDLFVDNYLFFGGTRKSKPLIIIKNPKKKQNKTKKAKLSFIGDRDRDRDRAIEEKLLEEETIMERPLEEEQVEELEKLGVYQELRKGGEPMDDYTGVTLDETGNITDDEFKKQIQRILNKNHMEISVAGSSYQELKALPDDSETFLKMFINDDVTYLINPSTFKKRILGLTSYFRTGSESMMPKFVKTENNENFHLIPVDMSEYQFSIYEKIRKKEAEQEKKKNKNKNKQVGQGEEVFEIPSTYRIFSRAACNFAFPSPPGRPMPNAKGVDLQKLLELIEKLWGKEMPDTEDINYEEFKKERKQFEDSISKIQKMTKQILEIINDLTEEEKVSLEDNIAKFTAIMEIFAKEKRKKLTDEEKETIDEVINVISSLLEKYNILTVEETEIIRDEDADVDVEIENPYDEETNEENDVDGESGSADYLKRIRAAMNMLKYDPKKSTDEQFLSEENLKAYSPKFLSILENIKDTDNKGLHLLYIQFRTIEGIGILKLVLETNGFAEFKIKKNESSNMWEIAESEEDVGKPRFVLYTGTETVEEKEIIRNIYNGSWEIVPASITGKLRERASNNLYGEVIKVLMITSSGAEGINLRNTRFVHIVEPYWHMVRLEQVIGRARRIGSHLDLPEKERTVKVFLYLSVFSNEQKTNKQNIEIMIRDTDPLDGTPVTTDQSLFNKALRKDKINHELLNAVKETAIDCNLYNPFNKEENLVCYGFGAVKSNAFSSYPDIEKDLGEMDDINIKKTKMKLKESKPIDGVIYAIDPATMNAYDMDSYREAQKGRGELVQVGKIVKVGNKVTFQKI